ncbi:MAG: class I SAM-dependent methyltransferase [bacterium]
MRRDIVWQSPEVVRTFVDEVRGGVPYGADQIAILLRVVAAAGQPVRRVLDLGCGSGVVAQALLAEHPGAQAVLVDFSTPMLARAREVFAATQATAAFIVGDLADSNWVEAVRALAPFDVVASSYAIHHLTDARKRGLYAEIFALLQPGGTFVNVEHVASPTPAVEALFDALAIDTLFAFQRTKGSSKSRREVADEFVYRPDKAANILAPVERQCEWLREVGFADVDCFFKVFELAVFGGRKP